jgi:hypothetical protein
MFAIYTWGQKCIFIELNIQGFDGRKTLAELTKQFM